MEWSRGAWSETNACFHSFFCKDKRYSLICTTDPLKTCIFAKNLTIIQFNNIPPFLDSSFVSSVIEEYISSFDFMADKLVYNFVSQEELYEMNTKFLSHSTHTDIITFNYTHDQSLRAEFFISQWAVERSAEEESQSVENECLRVLIHGALHCIGYNDSSSEEEMIMRNLEDRFIELFHVKHKAHV